jgi:hypothetical protein
MGGKTMKLSDVFQSLSGNKETLEERAVRLETQAVKLEADARLRKRIADAEKRIKAVKLEGLSLGNFGTLRGGLVKMIAIGTIVVIIILAIASKAC